MAHPIREVRVHAEVEQKAAIVERVATAGKIVVEFDLKDGRWTLGRISYVFPRGYDRFSTVPQTTCGDCGARLDPTRPECPNCGTRAASVAR